MLKVFISSPYSDIRADIREFNTVIAMSAAKQLFDKGYEPMCPLLWHFYDQKFPGRSWSEWIQTCFTWIECCDALVRLPGVSKGADLEVAKAIALGIPVFYHLEDLFAAQSFGAPTTKESLTVPDIKIQLLDGGKLPTRATDGSAAYDVYAARVGRQGTVVMCRLGFKAEIPPGYCAKLYPRSGLAKTGWVLGNSVGIIDSDYRGEWAAMFTYTGMSPSAPCQPLYCVGDRVAQLMIEKIQPFTMTVVDQLSETKRGDGAFGSTGK